MNIIFYDQNIGPNSLVATNSMSLGLGNRLRFTLSCQAIAEAEGRRFYYHWPVGNDFGAKLYDLWDYEEMELEFPGPQPFISQWGSSKSDLYPHRSNNIISLVGSQEVVGFGNEVSWEAKFRSLKTIPLISTTAHEILDKVGSDFIGVQVRAAKKTHDLTLEHSPVSWFINRMQQMLLESPSTRFFLSCDSALAEHTILDAVPNVVVLKKVGGYNTRIGLIEAVVDLVVLSRSRYLLGPYYSSFVDLAWALSNRSQHLETSQGIRKGVGY